MSYVTTGENAVIYLINKRETTTTNISHHEKISDADDAVSGSRTSSGQLPERAF